MKQLTFGSLFAGIGGLDLGFERPGMQCKWQVELDDYATQVLEKHWPDVRRHRDICTFPPEPLDEWRVDVICGGFPCQDIISNNQYKRGIDGPKSRLFYEVLRAIRLLSPRVTVLENVSGILYRGMGKVLGELAACGLDAWWECFPAAALGSPQPRWRTFIVAYPSGSGLESRDKWLTQRPLPGQWCYYDGLVQAERRAENGASFLSRVDDGVPSRVDRLKCLGNAVVPDVAEWIGRRVVEAMQEVQGG